MVRLTKAQLKAMYAKEGKKKWFKDIVKDAKKHGTPTPKLKLVNRFHGNKHWEIDY